MRLTSQLELFQINYGFDAIVNRWTNFSSKKISTMLESFIGLDHLRGLSVLFEFIQ